MTLVNIDLRNQGYETGLDDRVIFYSLLVREGDFGTISTAPVEVPLVDGKGSRDLAPGPVGVQIIAGQVADTRVKIGEVPPSGPTTLGAVMMVTPAYTPALQQMMIAAIERAKDAAVGQVDAEVAQAVDAEVGEFKTKAEQALARSAAAESKSDTALSKSATAESSAGNAVSRVSALEAMSGLSPESPVDGQTANLVSQPNSLTHAAVGQKITQNTGIYLVDDFGAVGDGVTDDTAAWQSAVDYVFSRGGGTITGRTGAVYMIQTDAGTSIFNDYGGIGLQSGVHVHIPEGCTLRAFPVTTIVSKLFRITDKSDVRIFGAGTLDGNRDLATVPVGSSPDYGYGVSILAGENHTIEGIKAVNFMGDGINLQKLGATRDIPPKNITIRQVTCDNNRRQGLSVESADGVLIEGSTFSRTNGTLPGAGIDVEAPDPDTSINNVIIRGCRFVDNLRHGLVLNETTIGKMNNITIENNVFSGNASQSNDGSYPDSWQAKIYCSGDMVRFVGNRITGTTAGKLAMRWVGARTGGMISSNNFDAGISVGGSALTPDYHYGLVVRDNVIAGQMTLYYHQFFQISQNRFTPGPGESSIVFSGVGAFNGEISLNTFQGGLHGLDLRNLAFRTSNLKISRNNFTGTSGAGIQVMGDNHTITENTFWGCCASEGDAVIEVPEGWSAGAVIEGNAFRKNPQSGTPTHTATYAFRSATALVATRFVENKFVGLIPFPPDQATGNGTILANETRIPSRATTYRPAQVPAGTQFYDTTLAKLLIHTGSVWRDMAGDIVP